MNKILSADLEHILQHTRPLWAEIGNKTILITGGTGFFGKWLLDSFLYINNQLGLEAQLIVLSRDPDSFLHDNPRFNTPCVKFIKGDIKTFEFPEDEINYIIHAATDASVALNLEHPLLMFDTIVEGTKRVLELARVKKVTAILHTSSGAVYGRQPANVEHVPEDFKGCPDIFGKDAAYGEGKRVAEMLCNFYYNNFGVNSKIARCFAFLGPYLPLNGYFAAGNFISNVLNKQDIEIKGDGTPYRSYLYAADLVIWLCTILLRGETCRPYNVGSDFAVSIEELAIKIATLGNTKTNVNIAMPKSAAPPFRYVPSVERSKTELHLDVNIDLNEALKRTIEYHTAHE